MPKIRVAMNKATGETTVSVACLEGQDCVALTSELEQAINGQPGVARELTDEYYEMPKERIVTQS